ncbi:uncharacterized protein HGUI_02748 [Hanseniaspora guilliermondii]|uniref:Ribosomal protein L30 ferredoxin-like fold domain-containing protein n=1 Tax=Hanseniaspora guilliermondii TaxID=56406 RepID=A0A1L0B415_9ASCO|nr:uncharacterized protein HGUI_02748 [Hanseniaspora guilliermondii]
MSQVFKNFLFANKIESVFYKATLRRSLADVPHTKITLLENIGITSRKLNKVFILPINKKTAVGLLKNKEIVNVEVVKVADDVIMEELKKINPDFSIDSISSEALQSSIENKQIPLESESENTFIPPEVSEYINESIREFVRNEYNLARKIEPGFSVVRH